jgi:site-specific DNA recombinase
MKKAIIYTRVSSKEQLDGTSLQVQERICSDYALKNDFEIVKVFVEKGESAKTADRTELKALLGYIAKEHKNINALIVYKVDRLARKADDHSFIRVGFLKFNIKLLSATENLEDTPTGRLMENQLAAFAQFDNEVRTERSTNGMSQAVKNGRYVWGAPLGYKNSGGRGVSNLVQESAEIVKLVRKCWEYVDTGYTPEEARKAITKDGLRAKNGKAISKSQFHRMLRNKVYMGVIEKFGLVIVGNFEPIVEAELFKRVIERLDGKAKNMPTYKKDNEDFPIRGLVLHSQCGKKLTASWSRGNGGKYAKYRCTRCPRVNYNRNTDKRGNEGLEDKFIKLLRTYSYKHQLKEAMIKAIRLNLEYRNEANKKRASSIEKELLQLSASERQITEKNIKGVFSDAITKKLLDENEQKISDLTLELHGYQNDTEEVMKVVEHSISILEDISSVWMRVDLETKKRFQKFLFPQGVPFDGEKFGTTQLAYCIEPKWVPAPQELHDVSPLGFEPRTNSLKGYCSTVELQAHSWKETHWFLFHLSSLGCVAAIQSQPHAATDIP